jgi:phage terminase large subunit
MVSQINIEDIVSIEETIITTLYDLTVEDNHNYYLDCGYPVLVHNSGKSFDTYDLLIQFCKANVKDPLSIYVVRKTLKSCREIAYQEDFVTKLKLLGLYDTDYERNGGNSPEFRLWGSTIQFIGLDTQEELGKSDIVYVNEALDIDNERVINDLLRRCTMLAILDWNPKYSDHFLFKWEGRFNTLFTKTTFRDNKHIPPTIKGGILAACPWDFSDYDEEKRRWKVPIEQRKPNLFNIEMGTANEREWRVYGDGERCPEEGAVFKDIVWIDEFPDTCEAVHFGLDFGYSSDPAVLTRVGKNGKDLFIEYLTYSAYDNPDSLYDAVMPILLEEQADRRSKTKGDIMNIAVACDSADRYKDTHFVPALNARILTDNRNIAEKLRRDKKTEEEIAKMTIHGIQFVKTKKPGITVRLNMMKKYKIHVVRNVNAVKEFDNYVYMMIEGRQTNIPIDKHNHGIDSSGYAVWYFFKW